MSDGGRSLVLAGKERVGGFLKGYQIYWNHCLALFSRFHATHCDILLPSTARHAGLVSEEKAISLSEKQNLPFTPKSGEIIGEFSKFRQKWSSQSGMKIMA